MPVDLLFYAGAPLVLLEPYMAAIDAVLNGQPVPPSFHEFEQRRLGPNDYNASDGERQLRSRLSSFGRLFRRKPPFATRLEHDTLLISDGLLDACYEKYRMKEWMKIEMADSVAKQWDARSDVSLKQICDEQGRDQIYTPVMHSAYRNFKYSRRGHRRLDMIRRFLGSDVAGKTLLDIGCNCGYYVFHFARQEMQVTGIDIDPAHLAIAKAQKLMYGLDVSLNEVSLADFESPQPFDAVIASSVIWHILGWGNLKAALSEEELTAKIEALVGKFLFWESGPQPEREINLIKNNTNLKTFQELGTTSATGIEARTFGVFIRS